jgi:hypothetical protein
MDLSGSRHLSFQEFSTGLARLEIPWQEVTGVATMRDVFKLFDVDKKGVLTLEKLFPETKHGNSKMRISTPDFWNKYCRGTHDIGQVRDPRWEGGADHELQLLRDAAQAREDVSEKRRWIANTMRRLKHQGKSDARCRELCALHLPKGTGPRDREHVHAFSDSEVKTCKKSYSEQVNAPVRNIQKTVYEMREQRRVLEKARQRMKSLTQRQMAALDLNARHAHFSDKDEDEEYEAMLTRMSR